MILFLLVIFWLVRGSFVSSRGSYTMGEFNRDLEQKKVEGVVIAPNRETPTGSVIITMKDGTEKVLYRFCHHHHEGWDGKGTVCDGR